MTRSTGKVNSTYRLTEQERYYVSILGHLKKWPKEHIARAFGVHRKTVTTCMARYPFNDMKETI